MQDSSTISLTGTIAAVKPLVVMNEPTSTSTLGAVRLISGSAIIRSVPVDIGTTAYVSIQRVFDKDPATAAAWTSSGFDAAEAGVSKSSDASSIRATAVYLMALSDGVAGTGTKGRLVGGRLTRGGILRGGVL